ncbi:RagB/SusD family nutrient uptake outer membrane protein [Mucilaginibacter terrigena]|uniref:RagB/SusD family nutrient uptake outer membrane protein n=1 Tax=Mucilaginibacter terrigena TaxID=2492395 RepID=A0A4Q5LJ12_9SPHI|nr:RagB/SusD family nutrient uptake outer membrane protein [Mucilaginibacter terrigena]RYU89275.1 RagB/SusD family nutrient uptake outer membrane protein [Mucilaginibacter terrigena]
MFNKNIKYALALNICAVLTISQGCKKSFLDVPPQAQQPSVEFFKTQEDATKAVNSIYANLREWKQTAFAPMAVESLGSDETEKGSSEGDATYMNAYDNFTVSATDGQLQDFWNGQYQSIQLCNQVLDNVPGIDMDAGLKSRYLAEAKFVRAYNYFRLVRAFGDVVLRLHLPKDASEYNLPRTPKAEVWAAIETDLTDAAAVLPQNYGSADVGRATKGAALALHAKVAMYQKKWGDVLTYTNQVMGMGYTLFPNFEQSFRIANENNSESVFEIQAKSLPGIKDASTSQYSQIQGVRGQSGGGWGFNVPTQALADAFETGDPRRDATIIFRGETTPEGDAIAATGDNPRYNQKSYVPFNVPFVQNEGEDQNVRVIRYAEVLLMNAEAANETGDATKALADLELVRARARNGNNAVLPKVTTTDKDALRTAIWHERQVELAMEFDRYFDVIRQGRAQAIFGPKGWKPNKNEVWPVPQNEIDLSAGVLTQNPNY